jgi:DNA adenine methylase
MLLKADTDDFVYLDPPYDPVSSTSNFTAYTHQGFGDEDQLNLKKMFMELNHKNCKVLLSNLDTPLIRKLYSNFSSHFKEVNVSRAINCKASKRVGHRELLICNYT